MLCSYHESLTRFIIVGWLYAMFLISSTPKLIVYIVALSTIIFLDHKI